MSEHSPARNLATLRALEAEVEALLEAGQHDRAAARASSAARFAWHSHPGVHASRRLEAALAEIGRRALPPPPSPVRRGHLVHVMSEASPIGGHVPLVERWLRRNPPGRSVLALTRHGRALAPGLARALEDTGGQAAWLGGRRDGLLERAANLRAVTAGAEAVVLHLHPDDVVPALAFGSWHGRPPVAHLNHADHCFWVGLGAADLVLHIRDHGRRHAARRRGVPEERSAVLPLPIDLPAPVSRPAARAALGIPPDAVVLLIAASAYKLSGTSPHLLDLVEPVLADRPRAILLAAGPGSIGRFAEASTRREGRVRALGFRSDLAALLAASDVFLDSFPCASLTAALEAAAAGLPVLSFQPPRPEAAVFDTDAPALGALHLRAGDADGYASLLARLVDDEAWREEIGEASRTAVAAGHAGAGWNATLERVRARLAEAAGDRPALLVPPDGAAPDAEDLALLALHERSGVAIAPEQATAREALLLAVPDAPDLSVVIVADERQAFLDCLDAAVAACEGVGSAEAVVVDNATRDGTRETLAAMGGDLRWCRLTAPASTPDAAAYGATTAEGDLVLLLGQDARVDAATLDGLRAALARLHGEEAVAPAGAGDPWQPGATGVVMLARGDAVRAGARPVPARVPSPSTPAGRGRWEPEAASPRSVPA